MAKLWTNITYRRCKQELNSTIVYINIESEEQESLNTNLNEQDKESNPKNEETQIQNQLDQWLKILQENNENIVDLDFDIM
ncbi:7337_t:CDS:2 [Funneliformis caledonium]|uniref:7337_t:CDS:1 n=1 Tax=Funneliformis caledonium TaxID=1117310 RepID=A0A9N9EJM5_9GLOM|nr:7337_t:CDS:2 [Funneliformis caledonium]